MSSSNTQGLYGLWLRLCQLMETVWNTQTASAQHVGRARAVTLKRLTTSGGTCNRRWLAVANKTHRLFCFLFVLIFLPIDWPFQSLDSQGNNRNH
jgi:hypothetical protein